MPLPNAAPPPASAQLPIDAPLPPRPIPETPEQAALDKDHKGRERGTFMLGPFSRVWPVNITDRPHSFVLLSAKADTPYLCSAPDDATRDEWVRVLQVRWSMGRGRVRAGLRLQDLLPLPRSLRSTTSACGSCGSGGRSSGSRPWRLRRAPTPRREPGSPTTSACRPTPSTSARRPGRWILREARLLRWLQCLPELLAWQCVECASSAASSRRL